MKRFFSPFSGSQKFLFCSALSLMALNPVEATSLRPKEIHITTPILDARSVMILDVRTSEVLYSKNPDLRLPPASTTKLMTAILALEKLSPNDSVMISRHAYNMPASHAGLSLGRAYFARDLVAATLVSSSNDAAAALAEAVAGSEGAFVELMNQRAKEWGMTNTRFANSTGLPVKKNGKTLPVQYTTAKDLSRLMRYALQNKKIDEIMGIVDTKIIGSDRRVIHLNCHNKMLWKTPNLVKGKTGWTVASKHTFVGTDYIRPKTVAFAMLCSEKPWLDIERIARFGFLKAARHTFV